MIVRAEGRRSGTSPSQSYALGSTTTLFIAVAALSPGSLRGLAVVVLRNDDAAAVRIEQDLGGVEPQSALGCRSGPRRGSRRVARPHAGTNACQ